MSAQKSSAAISTAVPLAAAMETPPEPTRRKRKSSTAFPSSNPTTSTKRLIKERNALNISDSYSIHNSGPYTRASRHSPVTKFPLTPEEIVAPHVTSAMAIDEVEEVEPLVCEEEIVDSDFDMVRLRGNDVHVVPVHAGWFSWKEIHYIEKQTLTSFFDGKSEIRTPEMYLKIRNYIVSKFHRHPQNQLGLKDLDDIPISDSKAKQEVMEFLEHWGLINFHPLLPENADVSNSGTRVDDTSKASLIDKLYKFEKVQPRPLFTAKIIEASVPDVTPKVIPESSTVDELAGLVGPVGPVGPSVEYHCNSCSADCSRNRYHCQKQADFDLCTECYKNEKFDSNMAPSDFILMEPAEVPGASSGSWTDQETLLLLEALELFPDNWNEVAEHVATKTKSQCILHFVQMPIEDSFFEDDVDGSSNKETKLGEDKESNSNAKKDSSICDNKETSAGQGKETNLSDNNEKNASDDKETNVGDSKEINGSHSNNETDAGNKTKEIAVTQNIDTYNQNSSTTSKSSDCVAIDALKAAFGATGYVPEQEGLPSFAEAGNPVMALTAFLKELIEPNAAFNSFRSSLKAISEEPPNLQLAARHCFILEDPPSDMKDLPVLESLAIEHINGLAIEHNNGVASKVDQSPATDFNDKKADSIKAEKCLSMEIDKDPSEGHEMASAENDSHLSIQNENKISTKNGSSSSMDCGKSLHMITEENGNDLSAQTKYSGEAPAADESDELELKSKDTHDVIKETSNLESVNAMEHLDICNTEHKELVHDQEPEGNVFCSTTDNSVEAGDDKKDLTCNSMKDDKKDLPCSSTKDDKKGLPCNGMKDGDSIEEQNHDNINRLKRAACTALSAAVVKAKLLANQEEDQIRRLVSVMLEKQMHKIEKKLALFSDIESVIVKMREQTERARNKLMYERQQIIAARLGIPATRANLVPQTTDKSTMGPSAVASQKPSVMNRP